MLTDYHILLVSGFVRTLAACLVLFGLLPRLVLPDLFPGEPGRRMAAGLVTSGALLVVIAHLLVLASMFDGVAFVAVIFGVWSVRLWFSGIRGSRYGFEGMFAKLLRLFDVLSWEQLRKFRREAFERIRSSIDSTRLVLFAVLASVIMLTGLVRLVPVWDHAAPFSMEYYDTLEHVKRLQLNQMYLLGYRVPLGLPMIVQTLSIISQVNVSIMLHFFGAISSLMLAGSIAFVVHRATNSLPGAIAGAALFGLFNSLLPMDVRSQVEADSFVLAGAFMLPSVSFLVDCWLEPKWKTLAVAVAGLLCTLMVNVFMGSLVTPAAFLIVLGALLTSHWLPWMRGKRRLVIAGLGVVLGAGFLVFTGLVLHNTGFRNVVQVLLYDQHINRYFSLYGALSSVVVWGSGALFVAALVMSFWKSAYAGGHLHLFSWGAFGVALVVLLQYSSDELGSMIPLSQSAALLAILGAVGFGIVVGWIIQSAAGILQHQARPLWQPRVVQLAGTAVALALLGVYSPGQHLEFDYTVEPDGFARSLYLIDQQYMPYQWTAVSHRGTALSGMNRGRFLDYGYFFDRYNPDTYKHGSKDAVPTPLLFIFVERRPDQSNVATELATTSITAAGNIKDWITRYQERHSDMKIFYSDPDVIVYKIEDPSVNALRG
ncbi:MAG TPA: hypothetical protein VMH23_16540 [Bacteroidota bacterium]|nr:hypothetical protein [Bacteroidota bacterium]